MTNKFRGELKVKLNKTDYNTRLTLDGIMRMEQTTGKPILQLANDLMTSKLSMTDIVSIMTIAMRGGGNNLQQKEVGEILFESGMIESMKVCSQILSNTITGGQKEDDEEKKQEEVSSQTD